jgi:hypothetical protein
VKSKLTIAFLILLASCIHKDIASKKELSQEELQKKIEKLVTTPNPNRVFVAKRLLLGSDTLNYTLREVIATNKFTGKKSIAYIVLKKKNIATRSDTDDFPDEDDILDWGIYTGWMLFDNGFWYHGLFSWSGTPDNYIFVPDANPYGDNVIGNEPRPYTGGDIEDLS